jgi:hypothetical protein
VNPGAIARVFAFNSAMLSVSSDGNSSNLNEVEKYPAEGGRIHVDQ